MKRLLAVQRLLGCINNVKVRARCVWTQDNIVNSPHNDVEIPNLTVPEYIWRNVEKWADRTAVVCGITNRSFTYNQLYEYSRNFGAMLRAHFRIKNGDVVGLMMPNTLEYPIAVIGAMQAGATLTTINPINTSHELSTQILLAKPKIIISSQEIVGVVQEALRTTNTEIDMIVVKNPNVPLPIKTISFEELIENNKVDKSTLNEVDSKPDDVVFLPYSSGTTGLPKGVELTNRNKVTTFAQREIEGVRHCNETTKQHQDCILAVVPFFHIYGLSLVLLHNLSLGAKIVVLPKFQPTTFLNAIKSYNVHLLYTAPPLVLFLGTHPEVKKEHLTSVDRIICGAAPIAKSDIRSALEKCQPNVDFFQLYGLTEAFGSSPIPGSGDHTTVGFALPNSQFRCVNSNDQNLGPDQVGELLIRGPQVMKGYKDNPEATKAAITENGWLRSGDLVSINTDGAVTIVDRIKELIKVKGHQVPPAELENVLKEHPDILDAAIIGIPDEKKGEVPKAFVVLKEGRKTTARSIIEFVSNHVAEYKRIKEVEFVDTVPKNPSGKILRRILREKCDKR